ncbi:hypothetical protein Tco_0957134 [Tanacetum coccineum]
MIGPTPDPTTPINRAGEGNNPNNSPSLQDQILSHMSSLEALIKQHNDRAETPMITPIRLTFGEERDDRVEKDNGQDKGKEKNEDLKKPYKEMLKSPFTRRIIEFSALSHRMPTDVLSCRVNLLIIKF